MRRRRDPKTGRPGLLPINRSTWYKWLKDGRVPPGRQLGPNTVAWPIEVIQKTLRRTIAERDDARAGTGAYLAAIADAARWPAAARSSR